MDAKPEVATAGTWEGTHSLFPERHHDVQVFSKKDPRGCWLIKAARQATQAGFHSDKQAHSPSPATELNKTASKLWPGLRSKDEPWAGLLSCA